MIPLGCPPTPSPAPFPWILHSQNLETLWTVIKQWLYGRWRIFHVLPFVGQGDRNVPHFKSETSAWRNVFPVEIIKIPLSVRVQLNFPLVQRKVESSLKPWSFEPNSISGKELQMGVHVFPFRDLRHLGWTYFQGNNFFPRPDNSAAVFIVTIWFHWSTSNIKRFIQPYDSI